MIGLVLVTHGNLGVELLRAAEHVCGPQERAFAVAIGPEDDEAKGRDAIMGAVQKANDGAGVLVLTDMFGGTPSNLAISIIDSVRIEVLAGVNLPMLIKFASVRKDKNLEDTAREAMDAGTKYIKRAKEILDTK